VIPSCVHGWLCLSFNVYYPTEWSCFQRYQPPSEGLQYWRSGVVTVRRYMDGRRLRCRINRRRRGNIAATGRRVITAVIKIIDLTYLRERRLKAGAAARPAAGHTALDCRLSHFVDCAASHCCPPAGRYIVDNNSGRQWTSRVVCAPLAHPELFCARRETTERRRRQLTVAHAESEMPSPIRKISSG